MPPFRRQTDQPLFPDVLWNRPVARQKGGRLLIIGGQRANFALPTNLYQLAQAAGIGQATVVLPDALRPLLAGVADIIFVPSSPSGSLGRAALGEVIDLAAEHDTTLLAGLSNNSETTILAEGIVQVATGRLILADDALGLLDQHLAAITKNPQTVIAATWPQLLRLARPLNISIRLDRADLAGKLAILQSIAAAGQSTYVAVGPELIVASGGELIVTETAWSSEAPEAIIALAATFWTQNPGQPAAGLATAAYVLREAAGQFTSQPSTTQLAQAIRRVYERF